MTTLQELMAASHPLALEFTDEELRLFRSGHNWGSEDDRAERGAAYLDRVLPGWAEHVTILRLDMSDTCLCVLGQLFEPMVTSGWVSGFSAGLSLLSLEGLQSTLEDSDIVLLAAQFLGFDHIGASYDGLTGAWQRLIAERTGRRAPQVSDPKPVF